MGFYDNAENVNKYIDMCAEYDGSNLYALVKENLQVGATLLELGSGPGFDIPFLSEHYQVTGSDFSDEFLVRCREKNTAIPFVKINALTMDIESKFDCIYSNKVLHHLTEIELATSLALQSEKLNEGGLIAHSFWMGDENEQMHGMRFTYYSRSDLLAIITEKFEVITTLSYQEFSESDSLFVIARLKNK